MISKDYFLSAVYRDIEFNDGKILNLSNKSNYYEMGMDLKHPWDDRIYGVINSFIVNVNQFKG